MVLLVQLLFYLLAIDALKSTSSNNSESKIKPFFAFLKYNFLNKVKRIN